MKLHYITASLFESPPCPGHKIKISAAIILLRSVQLLNIFDLISLKNYNDNNFLFIYCIYFLENKISLYFSVPTCDLGYGWFLCIKLLRFLAQLERLRNDSS